MTLVMRGFLVNISNPKALIFILAILPQFIDPAAPLLIQYVIIAATMVVVDLIVMAGYTGLAVKGVATAQDTSPAAPSESYLRQPVRGRGRLSGDAASRYGLNRSHTDCCLCPDHLKQSMTHCFRPPQG